MVILRPTRRLMSLLPAATTLPPISDTALGDWYVNRIVVTRRPLLLIVSSNGLLPVVIPARDVRAMPERLAEVVRVRLRRLGIAAPIIAAETDAMRPVVIAPTVDRSVLGIMVDFAKTIEFVLSQREWDETALPDIEDGLAATPCHAKKRFEKVIFPDTKAPELLSSRWSEASWRREGTGEPIH